MNVKEKFIELTSETYPHGHEHELIKLLPDFLKEDQFGNLYHQIGDSPSTMFTCHLDTASYEKVKVKHVVKERMIMTDGSSILGADDKAGVVVLLFMMEKNVPGLYYFFLGEERGCIGSRKIASVHEKSPIDHINKVVSFDRRGYDSVITHQLSGRSCSYNFALDLSNKLNDISKDLFETPFKYSPDSTGIYTDSAQFISIYAECTNISVGYHNEHTRSESQNIDHLEKLCFVVTQIDWDKINTYRDPKKNSYYDYDEDLDYGYGYGFSSYSNNNNFNSKNNENTTDNCITKTTVLDEKYYGYESSIKYDYNTYEITETKLHAARIMEEKGQIDKLLISLDIEFDNLKWDGNLLTIQRNDDKDITLKRNEIAEYLTNINDWIETEIKYKSIS
jgi:hypothetical protein